MTNRPAAPIISIEVCRRLGTHWSGKETFHACIAGHPELWGAGFSLDEAVGSCVRNHYDVTGIRAEFLENVRR